MRLVNDEPQLPRRASWRTFLDDSRRGLALGFRGDSGLFLHLFLMSLVIATGIVFGVSLSQWGFLAFAAAVVFSAEIGARMIGRLTEGEMDDEKRTELAQMGRAAVSLLVAGTTTATMLIFFERAAAMF